VAGRFSREPAFANGVLYVVNGSQLEARRESDGALQWSWSPAETTLTPFDGLSSNVVVTDNLAFVSTASAVYAVDLVTHQAVWSYPKAGRLALSPRGVLYIVTPAGTTVASVIAINLQ
jgi:outer membrane protein assembly factor BamB